MQELTIFGLINEEDIAAKARQSLVAHNIENFVMRIMPRLWEVFRRAEECNAGKVEAVKM